LELLLGLTKICIGGAGIFDRFADGGWKGIALLWLERRFIFERCDRESAGLRGFKLRWWLERVRGGLLQTRRCNSEPRGSTRFLALFSIPVSLRSVMIAFHRLTAVDTFCAEVHMRLFSVETLLIASLFFCMAERVHGQAVEDRGAIEALVQSEAEAWNRGDAEAFAAHFAEDGSFTNVIGRQLYGREAFIEQHKRIFSTIYKGSHNAFSIGKIKFLRPDVAVVDIDGILSGASQLPPGLKPLEDGAMHVKLQEVMTKESGAWMIAAFHNVAVYPLPQQK
jgi:uncharacterized protein (TIGR02246 family)